jgi:adenylate cyclase
MSGERVERRLAAILAVDVAGYSRLMGEDEEGTLAALRAVRRELGDPKITEHRGRIVKTTGDGLLVEFASVVDAVRCAVEVQREMVARNAAVPAARRIEFRMGVNVGDIIIEDGDIFGDGVNIAARLEALAEPGGICISAAAHEQVRDKLDFSFEDMGEQQVKNIARPVRTHRIVVGSTSEPISSAAASTEPSLPDKPSIAVLPFQNLSGDPEQEYFADGVVEDIVTALSRVGLFFVIARNSSFTYKGKPVDIKQVGRELGARYVLEGSIRKAANRVRITGQLIEATTGHHIWADRFDGSLDDIFDLQDRLTESVVGSIVPSVQRAEIARAYAKPTENLAAYDLYLRALGRFYARSQSAFEEALTLLERAIRLDPEYALAKALFAGVVVSRDTGGWSNAEEKAKATSLAREAVHSNRDDPDTLRFAAHALSHIAHDYELALSTIARAIRLNPNSAQALMRAGWVHLHAGDYEPALGYFEQAIRLSPLDLEMGNMLFGAGVACLVQGRNDDCLVFMRDAARHMPNYTPIYRWLAFACVRADRINEGRDAMARVFELDPAFRIAKMSTPFRDATLIENMRAAYRALGVPE